MTDLSTTPPLLPRLWKKSDKALLFAATVLMAIAVFDPSGLADRVGFALRALAEAAPFLLFAVLATSYVKASGAESLLSRAFEGREVRMIVMAAVIGGISPFCSCQVIPFIAGALAVGVPLTAVMAFWLSSPLMDPAMFIITADGLGLDFAVGKTVAAVSVGLLGGFGVKILARTAIFAAPLKPRAAPSACATASLRGTPEWRFWRDGKRIQRFRDNFVENLLFLGKWLLVAYILEAAMIAYVPSEWIATALGGDGPRPVLVGALIGAPAYLNGFAAVPLMSGLLEQGMAKGAAMSFMVAGGITCIPAAVAVWALVKPRVFASYVGFAFLGALLAGTVWSLI